MQPNITGQLFSEALVQPQVTKEALLKAQGKVRSHMIISADCNKQMKIDARELGVNADKHIGEYFEYTLGLYQEWFVAKKSARHNEQELEKERARLRRQFGPNWRQILMEAGQ